MNVALGPTRRSELTRAPSIRISVRPRARPRIAGTAACPSETWLTPATFSSACIRLVGCRTAMSRPLTLVAPAAGVESMLGADPDIVTDSLTSGVTVSTSSGSASSWLTMTGRA